VDPIPAITRVIAAVPEARLAVLFGSAATGRERPESDIDIGVFGSAATGRERPESDIDIGVLVADIARVDLAELRVRLERETGRVVDLVDLGAAPPLLRMEIVRHGRVLLERPPGAWSLFSAHAMIDWWDWAPTAQMMRETAARRLREEAGRGSS
jgi:uncharacterized protein